MAKKQCTHNFEQSQLDKITQLSEQESVSKSKIVRDAVEHYFKLKNKDQ